MSWIEVRIRFNKARCSADTSLMDEQASVSVVVPAWNAERFLGEAVASVLAQTHPISEIILVNDGSTDATGAVCDELARAHPVIRVVPQENGGPGKARDVGIAASSHPLIALLDADDLWRAEKIALQVAMLHSRPELDAVFAIAQNWFDGVPERGPTNAMAGYVPSCILFRRSVLETVGGFDCPDPLSDWVPWFLRLKAASPIGVVEETLVRRRVHDANRGLQHADARSAYARHVAEALRRRRRS